MKLSLKAKLILSFLAVTLLTVIIVSLMLRINSGQSLMNLVLEQQIALIEEVTQNYYSENGNLDGFFDYYLFNYQPFPNQSQPQSFDQPEVDPHIIRGIFGLVDADYVAIMPTFEFQIGERVPLKRIKDTIEVKVEGQTVAYILQDSSFQFKLKPEEELFLQRTNVAIYLAAGVGMLAAVLMGTLLASNLVKPIRRLTKASQALSAGNLEQQVRVTSQDELGQLTKTFNQMSTDLLNADQQRKRLTADITHDLSTPLQIIAGYMEMLEDKKTTLTPDRIEIIKTEIDHLRRLVADLSTLTQAETNELGIQQTVVKPSALLKWTYDTFQPIALRQGVTLKLDASEEIPEIHVDEGRMQQVIKNLLENALRYTTPKSGIITMRACADDKVELHVSDNGSGISPEDLPFVFDRFYRADKARGANSGKMGLGLAICKALVTAQGGEIFAQSNGSGKGTDMVIKFNPVSNPVAKS